jgi:hypothetical protein
MDGSDGEERRKTCREALPTDDQAAILFLEPGKGSLGLETRHVDFDRSAAWFLGGPDAFGDLRPDTTLAQMLTQVFGVIALIGGDDFWAFTGTATRARPQAHSVQQRDDLAAFITIGRGRAVRQGHTGRVREAVNEDALPLAATGHPLTAAFPRGKKSRRRPRTATVSSHVPRQSRGSGLA